MILLCSEVKTFNIDVIERDGEKRYFVTFTDTNKNEITLTFSAYAFDKLCRAKGL